MGLFFLMLTVFFLSSFVQARIEPIRFFSDPSEILMRDTARPSGYDNYRPPARNPQWRSVVKRRFNAYPPSFYTPNTFPLTFNRRSPVISYADLLFEG